MEKKKEPFIHVSKRGAIPLWQNLLIKAIAILLALVFCGIITTITTKLNPISVYSTMISGAFGTARKTWVTLQNTSILLLISLALTLAFKMRFWNLGGEGQVLMGALGAAACMIKMTGKVPNALIILCMVVSSIVLGGVWAFIPAFFKSKWNTNETLASLMMNYIATQIVAYFIIRWEVPKGSGTIGIINQSSNIGWLPDVGNRFLLSIIIALAVTLFSYIYLNYTKQGYEIAVVGESENTARYVGIKVNKVIVRTVVLSGAICGLVGLLLVGSINHTLTTQIVGGQGFTAVMVSWLSKFNPITMVFTSLLIVFMSRGAGAISTKFALNEAFADILSAIIIFFIIGCEFFVNYKISFRHNKKEAK